MRIGLISDTHIPYDAKALPPEAKERFKGVDLILHAGDIYLSSVLDELGEIAPVLAARGDDDSLSLNEQVKDKHILNFEGFSLWLTHGLPYFPLHSINSYPFSSRSLQTLLYRSSPSSDQELEEALGELVTREDIPDIIVFGHTHEAVLRRIQRFLLINPGSATFPRYRHELGTVAILTISPGKAEAEIIQL